MKTLIKTLVAFIIIVSVYFISCRADDQPCVNCPTTNADTMILRTDEFGNVLGGDTTDWCYRDTGNAFKFGYSYPNPTDVICTLLFRLPASDTVTIYFLNGTDTNFVINKQPLIAGSYQYILNGDTLNYHNVTKKAYIKTKNTYTHLNYCNLSGDIRWTTVP